MRWTKSDINHLFEPAAERERKVQRGRRQGVRLGGSERVLDLAAAAPPCSSASARKTEPAGCPFLDKHNRQIFAMLRQLRSLHRHALLPSGVTL